MIKIYTHLQATTMFGLLAMYATNQWVRFGYVVSGIAIDVIIYLTVYRKKSSGDSLPVIRYRYFVLSAIGFCVLTASISFSEKFHEFIGTDNIIFAINLYAEYFPFLERHAQALSIRGNVYAAQFTAIYDAAQFAFMLLFIVIAPHIFLRRSALETPLIAHTFHKNSATEIVFITLSIFSYWRLLIGTVADMDLTGYRPGTGDVAANVLSISLLLLPLHVLLLCLFFRDAYCSKYSVPDSHEELA